jgi:hypothetical protein
MGHTGCAMEKAQLVYRAVGDNRNLCSGNHKNFLVVGVDLGLINKLARSLFRCLLLKENIPIKN